jgi:hypothetical protein
MAVTQLTGAETFVSSRGRRGCSRSREVFATCDETHSALWYILKEQRLDAIIRDATCSLCFTNVVEM